MLKIVHKKILPTDQVTNLRDILLTKWRARDLQAAKDQYQKHISSQKSRPAITEAAK